MTVYKRVDHTILEIKGLFRSYPIGDSCLCWSLGDAVDERVSASVLAAYHSLKQTLQDMPGFRDLVPSYTALALHYDPLDADVSALRQRIEDALQMTFNNTAMGNEKKDRKEWGIAVRYGGFDIARVAGLNGLVIDDVIRLHQAPLYTVAMIGFIPHFPYLIGLDTQLATPRLGQPRTKVPAGAVAIGGAQTGIYPAESPGGWNIIGLADPESVMGIEPGDRVRFYSAGES